MSASAEQIAPSTSKQTLRTWLKLLKASTTLETAIRRQLRDTHNTTLPRFDVMSVLARYPDGLKMSQISKLLRISNANVTKIVDHLTADGLVQRYPAPNDRRAIEIRLTATGQAMFKRQASDHEQWINDLLLGLGDENLVPLSGMLDGLNDHLEDLRGTQEC